MKFLANENFPKPSVELLRQHGLDVSYIFEDAPGLEDEKVIARATRENRIILTFDKDYGEIIFRYKISDPPAVIYYRSKGQSPTASATILLTIISEKTAQLENHFTVIEESGVRQRKYLTPPKGF